MNGVSTVAFQDEGTASFRLMAVVNLPGMRVAICLEADDVGIPQAACTLQEQAECHRRYRIGIV